MRPLKGGKIDTFPPPPRGRTADNEIYIKKLYFPSTGVEFLNFVMIVEWSFSQEVSYKEVRVSSTTLKNRLIFELLFKFTS